MYKFEISKELYYHEIDLKTKLSEKVNYANALIFMFIGVVSFIYDKIIDLKLFENIYFNIFLFLATLLFFITLFVLFKSTFGYTYKYLPSSKEVVNIFEKIGKFYDLNKEAYLANKIQKDDILKEEFLENIKRSYDEAAQFNRAENIRKSRWLRFYSMCIISMITVLVILLIFIFGTEITNKNYTTSPIENNYHALII